MEVKDAPGLITTAQYDAFGRSTAITSPYQGAETRTTATAYDLIDNVIGETAPNGVPSPRTRSMPRITSPSSPWR
jgi:YD repeat-containing protein